MNKTTGVIAILLILAGTIIIPLFSNIANANESSGIIKVAVTRNIVPWEDWANATLYHLGIARKFIPIKVDIINDFSNISNYDVLFLDRYILNDTDIDTIENWVANGGILVILGISGEYANKTRLFSSGFETGDTSEWDVTAVDSGDSLIVTTDAFEGSYALECIVNGTNDKAYVRKYLTTDILYVSMYAKINSTQPSEVWLLNLYTTSGTVARVSVLNGKWRLIYYDGSSQSSIATTKEVTTNTWHHIELYVRIDDVKGAVELRVDGERIAGAYRINNSALSSTIQLQAGIVYSTGGYPVSVVIDSIETETFSERTTYPFESLAGISFNAWYTSEDVNILQFTNDWFWFEGGVNYTIATIPYDMILNVTPTSATVVAYALSSSTSVPALLKNDYGAGKVYLFVSDFPMLCDYDPYWSFSGETTGYNIARDGRLYNPIKDGVQYWWQIFLAIILENYNDIPIIASLPYNMYCSISWHMHAEGGYGLSTSPAYQKPDIADDFLYGNLSTMWEPYFNDSDLLVLKGWFWQFAIIGSVINGTSNATNILEFIDEWGQIHDHTYDHITDFARNLKLLSSLGKPYKFFSDSPGGSFQYPISDYYIAWKNYNGNGLVYVSDVSDMEEYLEPYLSIPLPVWNKTDPEIKMWFEGFIKSWSIWEQDIAKQYQYGEEYGLGGHTVIFQHDYETPSPDVKRIIKEYLTNTSVWITNEDMLMNWYWKRWEVDIINFTRTSNEIILTLKTPDIDGLTIILYGTDNIQAVLVDNTPSGWTPNFKRVVIPHLDAGVHTIKMIIGTEKKRIYPCVVDVDVSHIGEITTKIISAKYSPNLLRIVLRAPSGTRVNVVVFNPIEPKLVYAYGEGLPQVPSKTVFDSADYDCWYYDPASKLLYIKVTAHSDVPVTVYYTWTAGEIEYVDYGFMLLATILVLTIATTYIYVKKTKH